MNYDTFDTMLLCAYAVAWIIYFYFRIKGIKENDMQIKNGTRVRIKKDWHEGGKVGKALGVPVFQIQLWVPVIWDGEDDPDFHKLAGLETYTAASLLAEQRAAHRPVSKCSCGAELVDGVCPTADVGRKR